MPDAGELTRLIASASRNDPDAADRLWTRIREDVYLMAQRALRNEGPCGTLQPTELVSEVYCKLADCEEIPCEDRRYFFGMISRAIEQILADRGRRRRTIKRGGECVTVSLAGQEPAATTCAAVDPGHLRDALEALCAEDPDCAEVVRLKIWSGLTMQQVADLTGGSVRSTEREWQYGRLWLLRWMRKAEAS